MLVSGHKSIEGQYGETIEVPCSKGEFKSEDIFLVKWKYVSGVPVNFAY